MARSVDTCFGEFIIDGNIARSVMDDDFYYHLPTPNMTSEEIRSYFEVLKEMEE